MRAPFSVQNDLSRRFFLQGTGAVIALPFLASLLPKGARAATGSVPPVRYMSYFVPLGMIMDAWTPTGTGASYTLSPTLAPLAPLQKNITVVSGLDNTQPNNPDGAGGHARGTGQYNTAGSIAKLGSPVSLATTADQVVAQNVGKYTRLTSLQLGLKDTATNDGSYPNNYNSSISWSSPTTNVPPTMSPATTFKQLFPNGQVTGSGNTAKLSRAVSGNPSVEKSILDAAAAQAQSLQKQLGADDRAKLDQYLTGIRQVEQSVAGSVADGGDVGVAASACVVPAAPADAAANDFDTQFGQWSQLMTLAFQCDQTRVISFMFGAGESFRVYQNLGIKAGHHPISHYGSQESGLSQADAIAALKKIQLYELQCFAKLLTSMQAVKEANGTLLDNTLVMFSSELTDSNQHSYDNMPVVIAGGAGGAIKSQGQHLQAAKGTDYAQMLLACMRAVGTKVDSFGTRKATQSLPGLLG